MRRAAIALCILTLGGVGAAMADDTTGTLRIASFNAALSREGAGVLLRDFDRNHPQISAIVEIVLRVRPDILLVNELDHDPGGEALRALTGKLADGLDGIGGLDYPHHFIAPANTGVPSGHDLDGDGKAAGPNDAFGFGRFPGQYGMAMLSRVRLDPVRTFQTFRWADLPDARRPRLPDGTAYHSEAVWSALRLSSKSHWDAVAQLPDGRRVHLLASHPTPPVFDGPEDLNGRRNADEIRFWTEYLDGAAWAVDDAGGRGGLDPDALFVVLGDLNADPHDGDSHAQSIVPLLAHPRVQDPRPVSTGAAVAPGRDGLRGDPAFHTADWREEGGPGNLRVDYILPSTGLEIAGSGVFWPGPDDPLSRLVGMRKGRPVSSDHRLVWVDIRLNPDPGDGH